MNPKVYESDLADATRHIAGANPVAMAFFLLARIAVQILYAMYEKSVLTDN